MSNLLDKHGNLMLFDAAGNRVTLAGNPHFIERSRHNKMLTELVQALTELVQALTLLDTASQALVSAKQFISTMDKAGFINDANGELKNYQVKTDALLVGAKEFMNKYVNKEEKK